MLRITPGTMIIAIFAILFGLVGAYAVKRYLQPAPTPPAPPVAVERPINVPLASIDLVPGKIVRLGDIMIVPMTAAQRKERNLPPQMMANTQQIIGRILKEPMKKGEAFETTKFYPDGMGPSVAERLRPGLRAVTVLIKGTGVVNGLAPPGSIVDVLFRTVENPAEGIPEATITLLEGVEVLAVGRNALPGTQNVGEQSMVTLAVSTQQANALKIVEGRGEFSLSVRNPEDAAVAGGAPPHTLESLLKLPPKPAPFTTEIYRAGSRQTIVFERGKIAYETFGGVPVAGHPINGSRHSGNGLATTAPAIEPAPRSTP